MVGTHFNHCYFYIISDAENSQGNTDVIVQVSACGICLILC